MLHSLLLCCLLGGHAQARDPWRRPFAGDSIWNMPVGSGAVYVPADMKPCKSYGIDWEPLFRVSKDAPKRPLFAPKSWDIRAGGTKHLPGVFIDDDMLVPDARPGFTPNYCAALLMPDGKTVRHIAPMARPEPRGPVFGYTFGESDLFGDGILGSHGASRMSALGGSIRLGELTSDEPLRHALKACVNCRRVTYYGEDRKGFRWPAASADGYANEKTYGGTNKAVVMGSLLAVKPDARVEMKTPVGKKLLAALRDYGCYIVDDSAGDSFSFCGELGLSEEIHERFGQAPEKWRELHADLAQLLPLLHVVDNNSPQTIGGGGTPRAPLAPAFGPMDVTPPAVPANFVVKSSTPTTLTLAWTPAAGDPGLGGFDVFAGSRRLAQTFGAATVTLSGLPPDTEQRLRVRARDLNQNVSPFTAELIARTAPLPPGLALVDFEDENLPGWIFDHVGIVRGQLMLSHWKGAASATWLAVQARPPFQLGAQLSVQGGGAANLLRVHFLHQDDATTAYLEVAGGQPARLRLVRVLKGRPRTLAEATGPARGRYEINVDERGRIGVRADGRVIFENISDPADETARHGCVRFTSRFTESTVDGLRLEGAGVELTRDLVLLDDLRDDAAWHLDNAGRPGAETLQLTNWKGRASAMHRGGSASLPSVLSAEVRATGSAAGNLTRFIFCRVDGENYCEILIAGSGPAARLTLNRVRRGERKVLASAQGWEGGRIELHLAPGSATVMLHAGANPRTLWRDLRDPAFRHGEFGFAAEYNQVTVGAVRVTTLPPAPQDASASSRR